MKYPIAICLMIIIALLSNPSSAQYGKSDSSANEYIKSFINAVYKSNESSDDIARRYVHLSNSTSEFSIDKRYKIVSSHIKILREGKSMSKHSVDLKNIPIDNILVIPYNNLAKSERIIFDGNIDFLSRIYAVVENKKPISYYVYKDKKIYSFDYITKGSNEANYFIEY